MNQTIEQKRARYALDTVKSASKDKNVKQKEYESYATQFPVMIQQNGLGQACAFYRSKGEGGMHEKLYKLLSEWLCEKNQIFKEKDLLDGITNSDQQLYRIAQAEAQALLFWVAKFAKVYMSDAEEKKP